MDNLPNKSHSSKWLSKVKDWKVSSMLKLLIPTLILLLFKTEIEMRLTKKIVDPILSKAQPEIFADLIFFLIIASGIIYCIQKFKLNFKPSRSRLFISFILTSVYLTYRLSETPWIFTDTLLFFKLKYADLVILYPLINLLLTAKNYVINKTKVETELYTIGILHDSPILDNNFDKLGRQNAANLIAERIKQTDSRYSSAIAITGTWGSGKTSFLNLIVNQLKLISKDAIIISFNPWTSESHESIQKIFFETFTQELGKYNESMRNDLNEYITKITNDHGQWYTKLPSTFFNFGKSKSIEEINHHLKYFNRKVIVLIDDLDRLNKDEIIEIMKLIRNTASFSNTTFIATFDKSYITNSIAKLNEAHAEKFTEKIFQLEVPLPKYPYRKLIHELIRSLRESLPNHLYSQIEETISGKGSIDYKPLTQFYIRNLRDVIRYVNSIVTSYNLMRDEVFLPDLLNIEFLKLKYPDIYSLLYSDLDIFFQFKDIGSRDNYSFVYELKVDKNYSAGQMNGQSTVLHKYLSENDDIYNLTIKEIDLISYSLSVIFPQTNYLKFDEIKKEHLSIRLPKYFRNYFHLSLDEGQLSDAEFQIARSKSTHKFIDQISKWVNQGLEMELRDRFTIIKQFKDREDFEKIVKGIFHFSTLRIHNPSKPKYYFSQGNKEHLFSILSNYENGLVNKYYNGKKDDAEQFARSLFTKLSYPSFFESEVIRYINENVSNAFILSKEDTKIIALKYLEDYLNSINSWTDKVWELYHNCKYSEVVGNQIIIKPFAEANIIMQNLTINKFPEGFLISVIDHNRMNHGLNSVSTMVQTIFGSWEEFEKSIYKLEETPIIKEFKTFWEEFKLNDFKSIPFDFEEIKFGVSLNFVI